MTTTHTDALLRMAHSPIRNYAIPGLTSSLVGAKTRLFECSRDHQEEITPHSHRFDFVAIVLAGEVRNRIWRPSDLRLTGDSFHATQLVFRGACGKYDKQPVGTAHRDYVDHTYTAGQSYSMTHDQVHSIHFSRGAQVLFIEGTPVSDCSIILEPYVDGQVVPTFRVEPWMFQRAEDLRCLKSRGDCERGENGRCVRCHGEPA